MSATFLFLFSGGQDSIFFWLLILLNQNKTLMNGLIVNHETQLNSNFGGFHNFRLCSTIQQSSCIVFFPIFIFPFSYYSEEGLRNARYQISIRIKVFLQSTFFISAHNASDASETFLLNLTRGECNNFSSLTFRKKRFFKKTYYNCLSDFQDSRIIFQNKISRKTLKNFSLIFANNNRRKTFLYRPIKVFSRNEISKTCKKYNLPLFIDLTNFSISITRNRIRRHLLLYLQNSLKSPLITFWSSSDLLSFSSFKEDFFFEAQLCSQSFLNFNVCEFEVYDLSLSHYKKKNSFFLYEVFFLSFGKKNIHVFLKKGTTTAFIQTKNYISFFDIFL